MPKIKKVEVQSPYWKVVPMELLVVLATENCNKAQMIRRCYRGTKVKIRLPWELQFMFSEQHLETNDDNEQVDEEEKAATIASLKRLKMADDRTKNMTREEYVHWSECRQASFTFRKAKRFRNGQTWHNYVTRDQMTM